MQSAKTKKIVAKVNIPIGSRLKPTVGEPEVWNRRRLLASDLTPSKDGGGIPGATTGQGVTPARKIGSAHEQISSAAKEDMFVQELTESIQVGQG